MGKTCAVLRAVTLNSWTDTRFVGRITLPFVPIQSSRAEPTDQAEIVRVDQLELQEHCNADQTAATRECDEGKACSALRAVVVGLWDLTRFV
jgi:hypothetical protein